MKAVGAINFKMSQFKRFREEDGCGDYHNNSRSYSLEGVSYDNLPEFDDNIILHVPMHMLQPYLKRVVHIDTPVPEPAIESDDDEKWQDQDQHVWDIRDVIEERLDHVLRWSSIPNSEKIYIAQTCEDYTDEAVEQTTMGVIDHCLGGPRPSILDTLTLQHSIDGLSTNDIQDSQNLEDSMHDSSDSEAEHESQIVADRLLEATKAVIGKADVTDTVRDALIDAVSWFDALTDIWGCDEPLDPDQWHSFLIDRVPMPGFEERVRRMLTYNDDTGDDFEHKNLWRDSPDEMKIDHGECAGCGDCDSCLREIEDEDDRIKQEEYMLQYCNDADDDGVPDSSNTMTTEERTDEALFEACVESCEQRDCELDQLDALRSMCTANVDMIDELVELDVNGLEPLLDTDLDDLQAGYLQEYHHRCEVEFGKRLSIRKWRNTIVEHLQIRNIRYEQQCTDLVFGTEDFGCLVREIAQDYMNDLEFEPKALEMLQTASETYLTEVFTGAVANTVARDSDITQPRDMKR